MAKHRKSTNRNPVIASAALAAGIAIVGLFTAGTADAATHRSVINAGVCGHPVVAGHHNPAVCR